MGLRRLWRTCSQGLLLARWVGRGLAYVSTTCRPAFPAFEANVVALYSNRDAGMKQMLLLSAIAMLALPAQAGVLLKVLETEYTNGPLKTRIEVSDVLSRDAVDVPHLNLHPDTNAEHAALIRTLAPGIPFDDPKVRDQVAEILASSPDACVVGGTGPGLRVGLLVSPVEHIDIFVPGVVDKRRIGSVYLSGCLAENPPECLGRQECAAAKMTTD